MWSGIYFSTLECLEAFQFYGNCLFSAAFVMLCSHLLLSVLHTNWFVTCLICAPSTSLRALTATNHIDLLLYHKADYLLIMGRVKPDQREARIIELGAQTRKKQRSKITVCSTCHSIILPEYGPYQYQGQNTGYMTGCTMHFINTYRQQWYILHNITCILKVVKSLL